MRSLLNLLQGKSEKDPILALLTNASCLIGFTNSSKSTLEHNRSQETQVDSCVSTCISYTAECFALHTFGKWQPAGAAQWLASLPHNKKVCGWNPGANRVRMFSPSLCGSSPVSSHSPKTCGFRVYMNSKLNTLNQHPVLALAQDSRDRIQHTG